MKTLLNVTTKTLRFAIGVITLMLISVTAMYAQGKHPGGGNGNATPEEHAKRLTEMMKEKLSLTAAQEPKVSAINLKYAKKVDEARKIADTAARHKSVQNLNKLKDGELKTVLTAEQFKSYQKQVEEMKARRRQMKN
ncbi:MAG: hypothetical protein NT040_09830 [Bacteroidetes bacterium]|nr:hypothetical protein [Bacteroidota bacterium]